MKWKLAIVALLYALVIACGVSTPEPSGTDPRTDGTYATANARIDAMQTAISADLTAQAVQKP